MSQFYITLPSNTVSSRSNTTAEYRVNLAKTVELSGSWEVGLASIQYPYTWENFSSDTFYFSLSQNYELPVTVPAGNYASVIELTDVLTYSFKNAVLEFSTEIAKHFKWTRKDVEKKIIDGIRFTYNTSLKRVELKLRDVSTVRLSETLQYVLGFERMLQVGELCLAKFPPDLTSGMSSLFIYCDIIKPQLVGNAETPLLRTLPIKGQYGTTIVKDFNPIHYVELLNKRFDSVSIGIRDDTDKPVRFLFGKTIVKLHFRKKFAL